ncbi:MAG: protein phosphatase 2C domain-containing protein [Synechococcales bacterium]|nr:protein phosphatase 2C domain-containing protein [Synechococcales bacterium]
MNPETAIACQRCHSFLPKYYLWALNLDTQKYPPGSLLGDRYQVKQGQIVLDTEPGLAPAFPVEITLLAETYLRLVTHRPQVPELYGITVLEDDTEILLLENSAIFPAESLDLMTGMDETGSQMPMLLDHWQNGSLHQQLTWLRQLAVLWQPLHHHKASLTLTKSSLIRVEGSLIRLLELAYDRSTPVSLKDLGHCWRQWFIETRLVPSHYAFTSFLTELCDAMIHGHIKESDSLIERLDHQLLELEISGIQVEIATATDQGPSRQRNEDACFPKNKVVATLPSQATAFSPQPPLLIVCDGIGGHEGGDVASSLAIETLTTHLQSFTHSSPQIAIQTIRDAINQANDRICDRNDSEGRSERQRMGTTLVMALVSGYRLYLAHVGDSRAYRITRSGLHQLTLDDDLASREVRLGYTLYREALHHSSSGSLTQALGMVQANMLHATIQTMELAEDAVYLLCSDGLSDFDRLQECWRSEIVPLLDEAVSLEIVAQRLIEVANTRNGHDNVTVGLLSVKVPLQGDQRTLAQSTVNNPLANSSGNSALSYYAEPAPIVNSERIATRVVSSDRVRRGIPLPLLFLGVSLLGLVLGFMLLPFSKELRRWIQPTPQPIATLPSGFQEGDWVELQMTLDPTTPAGTILLPEPRSAEKVTEGQPQKLDLQVGTVPPGTILQVKKRQVLPDQSSWLQFQVCALPGQVENAVPKGAEGWHAESTIAPLLKPVKPPTENATCSSEAKPEPTPNQPTPKQSTPNVKSDVKSVPVKSTR